MRKERIIIKDYVKCNKMLYYISYGYIGALAAYKLYEYWNVVKFTYNIGNNIYRLVKKDNKNTEELELKSLSELEFCED